jgi:hypothetical protein
MRRPEVRVSAAPLGFTLQHRRRLKGKIMTGKFEAAKAKSPTPARPRKDTLIHFKMTDDFAQAFKARAVRDQLKLNELLEKCFAAYCRLNT